MVQSEVLFIGGRSGVGKSSVAYELHWRLAAQDVKHALIEGDNLDQAHPPPWKVGNLEERNLADLWRNYRTLGYRRLIFPQTVSVTRTAVLAAAMGDNPVVKAVLLRASDKSAKARLETRETETTLEAHLERSRQRALDLDRDTPSWVWRIDTDGKSIPEVAEEVLALLDWQPDNP
jgi:broad-specificity NMP kinase